MDGVQGCAVPDHRLQGEDGMSENAAEAAGTASDPAQAGDNPLNLPSLFDVEEAMRDVVDPELGINVVDLGLVYDLKVDDDAAVLIDMTLTSAACPLQDVIEDQTRAALVSSGLATDAKINWVWMPPWGPDKITDDGREQLRALGFTV
ncbi:metal-sulfur cluster biosynthesis protein [Tsukamurella sp. PLM1]|nr:metal-sulfur cluster biosynthesis protein [Tsukamurella sp. PLM1]